MALDPGPEPRSAAERDSPPLLEVEHLSTVFAGRTGRAVAVDDVSFVVRRGETLGLVGESGSGKSVTALSLLRLVPPPGRIERGRILLRGRNLLELSERDMRAIRGAEIAMVFQEPMTALNPVFTIGDQIVETLLVHRRERRSTARARAVELLASVRIPDPERRFGEYPHQLSGGLRQRALIALALAGQPSLLLADEPTTALDVTIQAEILDLLADLKARLDLSLLLITHDLGIVAGAAERVAVMYAGRLVEQAPVRAIFRAPKHPYTRGLLDSIPGGTPGTRLSAIQGSVPDPASLPPGCAFAPRCPERFGRCDTAPPDDVDVGPGHHVRCYLYGPDDGGEPRGGSRSAPRPASSHPEPH
jgi:oligopeptide/dipeptide ABC transporter ATP-binding protein